MICAYTYRELRQTIEDRGGRVMLRNLADGTVELFVDFGNIEGGSYCENFPPGESESAREAIEYAAHEFERQRETGEGERIEVAIGPLPP